MCTIAQHSHSFLPSTQPRIFLRLRLDQKPNPNENERMHESSMCVAWLANIHVYSK
jgi:hypothetical protein